MKAFVQKISVHPRYSKLYNWSKLITITGGAQVIVQVFGLICGIWIIRLLPTQEYALYTLANTMLGTMTVLADGGISTGVMAQGGKVWLSKEQLGKVLITGLELRKKFGIISLLIAFPALLYMLVHNGASLLSALLIYASLIPAFFAALSDSLLEIIPKLHQDIEPLQKNQIAVSIGRLALSGITLFLFPWTVIAIISNGVPRIYGNIKLKQIASKYIDKEQKTDDNIKEEILKVVKRLMPAAIYYSISSQVTIFLLSVFGKTTSIAQIGALGRLTILFNLFNTLFSTLFLPRFARLANNTRLIYLKYFQTMLAFILLFVVITSLVFCFPDQVLFVLGKQYAGLKRELLFSVIASCLNMLAGFSFSMYTSRGWAMKPMVGIPIGVVGIVTGILLFDFSNIQGALEYNMFLATYALLVNGGFCLIKINSSTTK